MWLSSYTILNRTQALTIPCKQSHFFFGQFQASGVGQSTFQETWHEMLKNHFKKEQKKRSKTALNTFLWWLFSVKHHSAASPGAGMLPMSFLWERLHGRKDTPSSLPVLPGLWYPQSKIFNMVPLFKTTHPADGPQFITLVSLVYFSEYFLNLTGNPKSSLTSSKYLISQWLKKKKKKNKIAENKRAIRFQKEKVCLDLHNNAPTRIQPCHTSKHLTRVLEVGWKPPKSSIPKQAWGSGLSSNWWKWLWKVFECAYVSIHTHTHT